MGVFITSQLLHHLQGTGVRIGHLPGSESLSTLTCLWEVDLCKVVYYVSNTTVMVLAWPWPWPLLWPWFIYSQVDFLPWRGRARLTWRNPFRINLV